MPEYRIINLDSLVLDSHNPRLPQSKHGSSESEIIKYMLTDSDNPLAETEKTQLETKLTAVTDRTTHNRSYKLRLTLFSVV